jgi:hypothetical protein
VTAGIIRRVRAVSENKISPLRMPFVRPNSAPKLGPNSAHRIQKESREFESTSLCTRVLDVLKSLKKCTKLWRVSPLREFKGHIGCSNHCFAVWL